MKSFPRASQGVSLLVLCTVILSSVVSAAAPLPRTNVIPLASTPPAVLVSWSGSDGATPSTGWRSEDSVYTNLGPPSLPAATSFLDETAAASSGYFYQVQANNGSGSSALSGADVATTVPGTSRRGHV